MDLSLTEALWLTAIVMWFGAVMRVGWEFGESVLNCAVWLTRKMFVDD